MAFSTCPHCNSTSFEMVEAEPTNSRYKLSYIQCLMCGNIVGVMPYFDIITMLEQQEEKMNNLERKVDIIIEMLSSIVQ